MTLNPTWNRRSFLTSLGLTTAATALPGTLVASAPEHLPARSPAAALPATHVFLTYANHRMVASGGILTYTVRGDHWQEHLSPADVFLPQALAAHPTLPLLYTASRSQHGGDPQWARRGRVNALAIKPTETIFPDPSADRLFADSHHWLNPTSQQPLALATTSPGDLAIAPDGRSLLVADSQGGHLNLLPLAPDGAVLPVEHALRQVGDGPGRPAQPHAVLFHPGGHVVWTTDRGADRLHRLALPTSVSGSLRLAGQLSFVPGAGPSALALHPSRRLLLVSLRHHRSITVIPVDPDTGEFTSALATLVLAPHGLAGPLLLSLAGDRVYTTITHPASSGSQTPLTRLHTLRLSARGRLSPLATTPLPGLRHATRLAFLGSDLLALGEGGLVSIPLDPRTGTPASNPVTRIRNYPLTGLALRPA